MIQRFDPGISPMTSIILLIFLTFVLIGAAALLFFTFAGESADPKHTYLTAESTGNSTSPLVIHIWKTGGGAALKSVYVSVSTPAGISLGTPEPPPETFFEGMSFSIGFDTGFPKGSYFVTVAGEFADGTTQVLFFKTMGLEAEGRTKQEVNTEKLILTAKHDNWAPSRVYLKDITPYEDISGISYWTLDLGYIGAVTKELLVTVDGYYTYPSEAFAGLSEKEFVVTYTAHYTGGKTKTTIEKKIKLYLSAAEDSIGKYVANYKIGGESLQGTGDSTHHIPLIETTSTEIWRTDIAGRYIEVEGQNLPALQINLNDPKNTAVSATITCDTEFRVGTTQYFSSGETYDGDFLTIYLNTANRHSITVTLGIYDINKAKLAEQTTLIIIRE